MKKLFMIVVLGLTMTSCSNTPTEVKNSKESTTVELQQLASIDSVTYKVVEKGSTVYILSTKDNLVVKQIRNHSGGLDTMVLLWIGLWIGLISYLMIKD
jgi:PBP1b-binding outer membrane lipoprotein LpoB